MKALILAGGLGTRLKPLTNTIPKCMVDINGKPCLERIVEHLNYFGITEIMVNLHYLYPQVLDYFGNRLIYTYEPELLGEEKTILRVKDWLGVVSVVCNGDTLTNLNITDLAEIAMKQTSTTMSYDNDVYTGTMIYIPNTPIIKAQLFCNWIDIGTPERLSEARENYEKFSLLPKV